MGGDGDGAQDSWTELSSAPGGEELFSSNARSREGGRRRTGGWAESRNNSLTQKSSFDKSEASEDEDLPIIPDLEVTIYTFWLRQELRESQSAFV